MSATSDNFQITHDVVKPRRRAQNTTQARGNHRNRRVKHTVTVTRVPDIGMAFALAQVDGDASRLVINSDGTVLIKNRGRED